MTVIATALQSTDEVSIDVTRPTLAIHPWRDPIVARVGFDACGDYVELFWLPIIGPTSTWLLRRLAVIAVLYPDGFDLRAADMAHSLGLGADAGPRSSFTKSLQRLELFGLVRTIDRRHEVRTVVPPLTLKHLTRLPDHLQCAHSLWAEADSSAAYSTALPGFARFTRTSEESATESLSVSVS